MKKKIFPAVSASVFTCGPNDNTSPNFSWAIILNSCSSRHKKRERANKYQHTHRHTHVLHVLTFGTGIVVTCTALSLVACNYAAALLNFINDLMYGDLIAASMSKKHF